MSSTTPTLADLESLAAEEPFVRSLARSLVFDATQVDDVVQQTWLECLRRAVPDGEHRRPWLARVVRSRASNLRRAESRRRAREKSAAIPESGHGPDELVERAEQRRHVVEAVLELPPIYRQVVLLRFFENLPPRKISAQLGVPANTVSTRIRRALDMLRERFDSEHGGDRRSWQLALVPLAVPGGRAAAVGAAGATWASWATSAALPWVVVLSIGLGVVTWWLGSRDDRATPVHTPQQVTAATATGDAGDAERVRTVDSPGDATPGERVELATAAGRPAVSADDGLATLVGRIVSPDGAPAANRRCRLWSFDPVVGFGSAFEPFGAPADAGPRSVDTVTDADGVFRFDRVSPEGLAALWLAFDGPNPTWRALDEMPPPGGRLDVGTLRLAIRGAIRGTVVGPQGQPVAGAEVWAADVPGAALRVAPVDRLVPGGALLIALPEGAPTGSAQEYHEALRHHLGAWVLQAEGDAKFQVLPMADWASRMLAQLPVQRTTTDAAGGFELQGVARGDNVLVVTAPGCANGGRTRVAVREGEVHDVGRIRLAAAEPFVARVVDSTGAPVAGAEVRVALRPRIGLTGILFAGPVCVTAADGTVHVDSLPRGDVVVCYRGGPDAPWLTQGPVGSDEAVDLRLPPTASLRVAIGGAADVDESAFRFRLWQGPPFSELTAAGLQPVIPLRERLHHVGVVDGEHVWTIDDLAPGLWTLAVSAEGRAAGVRLSALHAGDNDPLSIELAPGGDLRVTVEDGSGGAVEGAQVFVDADGDHDTGWQGSLLYAYGGVEGWDRLVRGGVRTAADGTATIRDLPAGGGLIVARHPARGVATLRYESLEAGARVVLRVPGSIAGRLTLRGAAPARGTFRLTASSLDGLAGTPAPNIARVTVPADDGSFRFDDLAPGRWEVAIDRVDKQDASNSFGGLIEAMTPSLSWGYRPRAHRAGRGAARGHGRRRVGGRPDGGGAGQRSGDRQGTDHARRGSGGGLEGDRPDDHRLVAHDRVRLRRHRRRRELRAERRGIQAVRARAARSASAARRCVERRGRPVEGAGEPDDRDPARHAVGARARSERPFRRRRARRRVGNACRWGSIPERRRHRTGRPLHARHVRGNDHDSSQRHGRTHGGAGVRRRRSRRARRAAHD